MSRFLTQKLDILCCQQRFAAFRFRAFEKRIRDIGRDAAVDRRMRAIPVVIDFDEFDHSRLRLSACGEAFATIVDYLQHSRSVWLTKVGDLNVAFEDCCIGRGPATIHSEYPSFCLYLMRSLKSKLDTYNGEGTVFGSINGKSLKTLPIALPNKDKVEKFELVARPIDNAIMSGELESRNLTRLRDASLPKLISGEIDVSSIKLLSQ